MNVNIPRAHLLHMDRRSEIFVWLLICLTCGVLLLTIDDTKQHFAPDGFSYRFVVAEGTCTVWLFALTTFFLWSNRHLSESSFLRRLFLSQLLMTFALDSLLKDIRRLTTTVGDLVLVCEWLVSIFLIALSTLYLHVVSREIVTVARQEARDQEDHRLLAESTDVAGHSQEHDYSFLSSRPPL
jgi:hypothetical protein